MANSSSAPINAWFVSICDSPFWNANLSWNTETPTLSSCFVHTALVWPQSILLWCLLPYTFYDYLHSRQPSLCYNARIIIKLILALTLVTNSFVRFLAVLIWIDRPVSRAEIIANAILLSTYALLSLLLFFQRVFGFNNNGAAWFFLLLHIVACSLSLPVHLDLYDSNHNVQQYIELICVVLLFIACCFGDNTRAKHQFIHIDDANQEQHCNGDNSLFRVKNRKKVKLCPKVTASFLSKLTFFWFDSMAIKGFRKPLELEDLWEIRGEDKSSYLFNKFNRYWRHQAFTDERQINGRRNSVFSRSKPYATLRSDNSELREPKSPKIKYTKQPKTSVFAILGKRFWFYFLLPNVARFFTDLLQLVNPMVLKFMIAFTMDKDEPFWHGMMYALVFVLTNEVQSICSAYQQHRMSVLAMRIRTCLIGSIFRKNLVLSMSAKKDFTTGEIVNLQAVDSQRFVDLVPWICFLWTAPVQIGIGLWLLWSELGPSVIGGLVLMILFIPLNGFVANYVKTVQTKQMQLKDVRLKAINEMLSSLKVLRLLSWEDAFSENVHQTRKEELHYIRKSGLISTIFVCISACSPFMVSSITFAIYILTDEKNVLTPEKAFVSIALFNLLRVPLTMLPNMFSTLILTLVSVKRLNRFLNAAESQDYVQRNYDAANAITMKKASFVWDLQESKEAKIPMQLTLSNIDFAIPRGSLVSIVGNVGCGKSSLLYALLGEMQKQSGEVNISNDLKIAYVAQQAWIQNCTVKDNILFGKTLDQDKYDKVISACALLPDFKMLPGGDNTEIGEKGINLSGGQKQRISIARACYSESDVFLFDDPLSAVDSHVGKHIFDKVLSTENGLLAGQTRVLVTNALYVLNSVDRIILLKNGTIEAIGGYDELMDNCSTFHELINNYTMNQADEQPETEEQNLEKEDYEDDFEQLVEEFNPDHNLASVDDQLNKEIVTSCVRTISVSSIRSVCKERSKSSLSLSKSLQAEKADKSRLVQTESVESGRVSFQVYKKFVSALSFKWTVSIVINYFLITAFNTGSSFWLATWTDSEDQSSSNTKYRLSIYFVIGMLQAFFVCFGWISIIFGTLRASRSLHEKLLNSIMHAPMYFLDTTPLGRIVNRFSKDIDILDVAMQFNLRVFLNTTYQVLAVLFIVSFQTPIFLAFVIPFMILYLFIQRFYVSTSRQLKRLESVTRSPIYTHFSETINGVSTIKAYNACERFIEESDKRVDINQRCFYPNAVSNCWLQVRLEFMANLLIFFAAFFAAFSRKTDDGGDGLSGSETGLSLSYALNVTLALNWFVRTFADFENNAVAVERITEYTDVPPEAPWKKDIDDTLDPGWPQHGVIQFQNYGTRYRPGLDLVLKGIDLKIEKGEKIGIVGRTGAGKSSLTLSLFRIIEAAMGRIVIDGVDISQIGLQKLRGRLTIIPQDPVLFCGTIRQNLDPFNNYSDEQLWWALKMSHLKDFISSLEQGLEHAIVESGENLSVGQRQLICLARALLKRTQILVLDEATAAVDLETDSLIQSTIRAEFSECTVLTIAHRLNTILDSTRILVLDAGYVAEFDTPKTLLSNPDSIFYSLAQDAGIV